MKKTIIFSIFIIFFSNQTFAQNYVNGQIKDSLSNETISDVYIKSIVTGKITKTNNYGFFSYKYENKFSGDTLEITHVGFATKHYTIKIPSKSLVINLIPKTEILKDIVVLQKNNYASLHDNFISLTEKDIKSVPQLLGEKDPLKAIQLLPGIRMGMEGTSGLYVRGGGADQNLFLLDEAVVYNANHLFGIFSTFNPDPISTVSVYKAAFPARYGGRLSSVIDFKTKEGSLNKVKAEATIGLITSKITIAAPIIKDKLGFSFSYRRTYLDYLIKPFMSQSETKSYRFFDSNFKLNYVLNQKNKFYFAKYSGEDLYAEINRLKSPTREINEKTGLDWGNKTYTLRWNKVFSQNLFTNLSLIHTNYKFKLYNYLHKKRDSLVTDQNYNYLTSIKDFTIKYDVDIYLNAWQCKLGIVATHHNFNPRDFSYTTTVTGENNQKNADENSTNKEGAAYVEFERIRDRSSLNIGLRVSFFETAKKLTPKLEPRISYNFKTKNNFVYKASYTRMNQFVHQLSNTGFGLPTDFWVPSTESIPIEYADQLSLGVSKQLGSVSLTAETYYKKMNNIIQYKNGGSFTSLNDNLNNQSYKWEDNITSGKGWAYGYELLAQKKEGKFNTTIGYTLSWAIANFKELNQGINFYLPNDRRHDFELNTSWQFSKKISFSSVNVFATGNSITVPTSGYFKNASLDSKVLNYTTLFNAKAHNYHRMDLGVSFSKEKKHGTRSWDLNIYNVYFRKNPFNYTIESENFRDKKATITSLQKEWLLPILPSISYTFKLK
jgi:hypothetical protein